MICRGRVVLPFNQEPGRSFSLLIGGGNILFGNFSLYGFTRTNFSPFRRKEEDKANVLGPEESSRAIPPLAELLAIRRIESFYHKNARQTLFKKVQKTFFFLRPFTGQDELYFYRCYHTLLRCNIFFRPKGFDHTSLGNGKDTYPESGQIHSSAHLRRRIHIYLKNWEKLELLVRVKEERLPCWVWDWLRLFL